ncbi:MAG TPA: oxidoreductase [Candidatus Baltobacteraceae bacterium]|nr:oxidoreductase [Candidatus Baltobacteraceae bacterium]
MKLEEVTPFFGKRVVVRTRGETRYEGVLEKVDNDPQRVYLQPVVSGERPTIPLSEIRAVHPASAAGTITIGGDLSVHRMGYGAMRLTGPGIWGWPEDRENALRVLRRAVELGVNFIDTADAYGPEINEEEIATALHPYPPDVVIATKGGNTRPGPGQWEPDCRPERLKACCEGSLRRLKLDRIDLYQLHTVDDNVPFEEQVGALRDLRDEGKIRHVGLSNVSFEELRKAQQIVPIVSVQNRYNMMHRGGDNERIIEYCETNGLAFLPWFPLGAGDEQITDNTEAQVVAKAHGARVPQIALAWLLHRSPCVLPIPGTSSIAHLEENMAAANIELNEEDLVRLGLRQPASAHHGAHDER